MRPRAHHGNRIEAEATAIITVAVQPAGRIKLGSMLAEFWRNDPHQSGLGTMHLALSDRGCRELRRRGAVFVGVEEFADQSAEESPVV
jgi:plasmid stability protein